MRHQLRSVSCDKLDCDDEFEQDGFIAPKGVVTWADLESAAREEGWTCKDGEHFCPEHSSEWEPFG